MNAAEFKAWRETHGFSVPQVAHILMVSKCTVNNWESSKPIMAWVEHWTNTVNLIAEMEKRLLNDELQLLFSVAPTYEGFSNRMREARGIQSRGRGRPRKAQPCPAP